MAFHARDIQLPAKIIEIFPSQVMAEAMVSVFKKNSIDDIVTQSDVDSVDTIWLTTSTLTQEDLGEIGNLTFINVEMLWVDSLSGDINVIPDFTTLPNIKTIIYKREYNGQKNTTPIPDYKNYPLLTHLTINAGSESKVPDFSGMPNLELLDLTFNEFTTEDIPDFSQLNHLSELNLYHNLLMGSSLTDFTHLISLQSLNLGFNGLTSLPQTPLSSTNVTLTWLPQLYTFEAVSARASTDIIVDLPIYFQVKQASLLTKALLRIFDINNNEVSETPLMEQGNQIVLATSHLSVGSYQLVVQLNDTYIDPDFPNMYIWPITITN